MLSYVRDMLSYVGAVLSYVGAVLSYVEAVLSYLGAVLGRRWLIWIGANSDPWRSVGGASLHGGAVQDLWRGYVRAIPELWRS